MILFLCKDDDDGETFLCHYTASATAVASIAADTDVGAVTAS